MSAEPRTMMLTPLGEWAARMGNRVLFQAPCHSCRVPVAVRSSGVYNVGGQQAGDRHACAATAVAA